MTAITLREPRRTISTREDEGPPLGDHQVSHGGDEFAIHVNVEDGKVEPRRLSKLKSLIDLSSFGSDGIPSSSSISATIMRIITSSSTRKTVLAGVWVVIASQTELMVPRRTRFLSPKFHVVELSAACSFLGGTRERSYRMMPFDRVMHAYGMMVNLTYEQEEDARERLRKFFENRTGTDQQLAVEGVQFLRGNGSKRRRSAARAELSKAL